MTPYLNIFEAKNAFFKASEHGIHVKYGVCVCILIWLGHQQAMQFEELPMTAERSWRIPMAVEAERPSRFCWVTLLLVNKSNLFSRD